MTRAAPRSSFDFRNSSLYGRSQDQHAIAVTEKPISLQHGFLIRAQNKFTTRKGAHKHKQSRFRQMKVGEQNIDRTKLERRIDKNVGLALARLNFSKLALH